MKKIFPRFLFSLICTTPLFGDNITWVAHPPNSDLNTASNWNPSQIPNNTDNAIFDSSLPNLSTTPSETDAGFSVLNIEFTNQASPFTFNFSNQSLEFNGTGIIGNTTNTVINSSFINYSTPPTYQVGFIGATGSSGSATLNCLTSSTADVPGPQTNQIYASGSFSIGDNGSWTATSNGTLDDTGTGGKYVGYANQQIQLASSLQTGDQVTLKVENNGNFTGSNSSSGNNVGTIDNNQFKVTGHLQTGNNFSLNVSNSGVNNSTGFGNNSVGIVGGSQAILSGTSILGNNASITLSNSGNNSGDTTNPNLVGYLGGYQFTSEGAFQAGNNFTMNVANSGTDSSTGSGGNNVAKLIVPQVGFADSCLLGDNATIAIANNATNSGSGTNSNFVGYMIDQQFHAANTFQAGDNLTVAISNIGFDNSSGNGGHYAATIDSNSGTSGMQMAFSGNTILGNNANISAINRGTYQGTNTLVGSKIANLNDGQIIFQEEFSALDHLTITATNEGIDSAVGFGGDVAGTLSSYQIGFSGPCTVGDYATMTVSQMGHYSGSNSSTYCSVGSSGTFQFYSGSNFNAGNHFSLAVSNEGINSGQGYGANWIASSMNLSQVKFDDQCQIGNYGSISVTNKATNSNTATNGSYVATLQSNPQCHFTESFQAGDHFSLLVGNTALDNSVGTGNGTYVGVIFRNALQFDSSCSLGDFGSIEVVNAGSKTGVNTDYGNQVGLESEQLHLQQELNAGNFFSLKVQNSGTHSAQGAGGDFVGIAVGQANFLDNCVFGDGTSLEAINQGTYTGNNTTLPNYIGWVSTMGQLNFQGTFTAGDALSIGIHNQGNCNTSGIGNTVAYANGPQLILPYGWTIGDDASILVTNSGSLSSNGSTNTVGTINGPQVVFEDDFIAGSNGNMTVVNSSLNYGLLDNIVGQVDGLQVSFEGGIKVEDGASFSAINNGLYQGINTLSTQGVAVVAGQIEVQGKLEAGDNFLLQASNIGVDNGSGTGNRLVAMLPNQVLMDETFTIGDRGAITICNEGIFGGSHDGEGNTTGFIEQSQLFFLDDFTAANNLTLNICNKGQANTATDDNEVGYVEDEQLLLLKKCTVGNGCEFILSNTGEYSGEGTHNRVGYINGYQAYFESDFSGGNHLNMIASNKGVSGGGSDNFVGYIQNEQLLFTQKCTVGNAVQIGATNYGELSGTGTTNTIGCIDAAQIRFEGDFVAGSNLKIVAQNERLYSGSLDNLVGNINDSQLVFDQGCSFGNNSQIIAVNAGTVANSQVLFNQGFTLTGGKAAIKAYNLGTVGDHGIKVLGNSVGGDINIVLGNSSLYVNTTASTFTIGELNGDSTSTVESKPNLIINTVRDTTGIFAGTIKNFAGEQNSLIKSGEGTQILAGPNAYTGLTTVNEGTLALTGSIVKDMVVNPNATLKGTGIIGGNLSNEGTVSPGMSIGTLTIAGNFTNIHGDYALEFNHRGESDLINVGDQALLEGGTVWATLDGSLYQFYHPYTILQAGEVVGKYSQVKGVNLSPMVASKLSYDPTHVYFMMKQDISKAADTHNQSAVAKQLDSIHSPTPEQNHLLNQMVNLSFPDARESLDSLSGYQHADDLCVAQIASTQFIRRLYDPLRTIVTTAPSCQCNEGCGWTDWFEGEGGHIDLSGNKNAHGLKIKNYELSAGIQRTFCKDFTLGIAGSYQNNRLSYREDEGSGRNNIYFGGLYGLYRPSCFYGLAEFTYGYAANTLHRSIRVGAIHEKAKSRPKLTEFGFYGEIGVDIPLSEYLIQPFIGIEGERFCRHHVKEKHAQGLNLDIHEKEWSTSRSRLGLHLSNRGECAQLSLDLAWNKFLSCPRSRMKGRFKGFGRVFTIDGIYLSDNSFDYSIAITTPKNEPVMLYIEVSGEAWKHATSFNVVGGLEISW